ncbi:MAG: hypothetical protein ACK5U0_15990, partial [Gemmatimonas sp.]|uniref:hypothetical protein n=1 Tax=Gemmatimonas sp. TaxID=1962908 RepID=UPI00391A8C5F
MLLRFATALAAMALVVAPLTSSAPIPVAVSAPTPSSSPSDFLYLWASSVDSSGPDFLAVYDVRRPASATARYGRLVTTLAVPGRGRRPHPTEHTLAADRQLFANDFGSGESYVFDLTRSAAPRLVTHFEQVGA